MILSPGLKLERNFLEVERVPSCTFVLSVALLPFVCSLSFLFLLLLVRDHFHPPHLQLGIEMTVQVVAGALQTRCVFLKSFWNPGQQNKFFYLECLEKN